MRYLVGSEMRKIESLKAEDVMAKKVVTVGKDTTIKELQELFDKYKFNGFPVVENDRYIGMVYDLDLLKAFVPSEMNEVYPVVSDFWKLFSERVDEVMERGVPTAAPKEELEDIVTKMMRNKLKSIPIVEGGKLVGIIALADIFRHLFIEGHG